MRDLNPIQEQLFFDLFKDYFDSEKDAGKQHDVSNYSLDRMYPLAELAGNPERRLKILHIAGTKGKGTTSHFTSALLSACGKRVGLFTSPHLSTVRERFQLDNKLVPYDTLISSAKELLTKIKTSSYKPSLFEIFTVLALKIFADAGLEYAVLETGIGGRLDATNYIKHPEITIITPVSFDHIALLGNTIEAIAGEKAGIIKPGVPLVISRQPYPAGEATILARAASLNSPVIRPLEIEETDAYLPKVFPQFLRENFSSALAAIQRIGLSPAPEDFVLPQLRARFETIHEKPLVLIDGAHNGDSMQKLVSNLNEIYSGTHWLVILGCVAGKDIRGITSALKELNNAEYILTNPHTGKGSALETLKAEAENAGLNVISIIPDIKSRSDLPSCDAMLFTGSFFTALIGEEMWN